MSIIPSEEAEKERIKRELTAISTQDAATIILKSALGAIPGVGAAFIELIDAKMSDSTIDRIAGQFAKLEFEGIQFRERINTDYLKTDEAAFIFREMLKHFRDDYQTEKLDAYRAIFLNSIIESTPSQATQELKEVYLGMLGNLTVAHIKILKFVGNPDVVYRQRNVFTGNVSSLIQGLAAAYPEYSQDLIRVVWGDLRNVGLVKMEPNSLGAIMSGSVSEQFILNLTTFGRDFISYIRSPLPQ